MSDSLLQTTQGNGTSQDWRYTSRAGFFLIFAAWLFVVRFTLQESKESAYRKAGELGGNGNGHVLTRPRI